MRGREYDEVIDELIEALRERYGTSLILHWEDFNVRNSFRLLDKYVAQVRHWYKHAPQLILPSCYFAFEQLLPATLVMRLPALTCEDMPLLMIRAVLSMSLLQGNSMRMMLKL